MAKLQDYAQFIFVKVTYVAATGKWIKEPVDLNGNLINPLDPKNWMDYTTAFHSVTEHLLGFVFTEADPFSLIDIDNCLLPDGSDWSPLAYEVLQAAGGGMVEISHSGRGLHIIGSYQHIPPHKCKNTALHLELYHENRFVLLGKSQRGNEGDDLTATLPTVINKWFKPDGADRNGSADWTDGPCEGWAGPSDDDELIAKALSSVNASSLFGGTVTFKDLWECNEEALSKVWPDPARPFDASSADAALAQRLAFWTGRDCERMQRLMLRSGLVREKYERADYLPRTILGACQRQVLVYNKATPAQVDRVASTGGWVSQSDIPTHFAGCVYIEDRKAILAPDGVLLDREQFDVRYGGNVYVLDERKSERSAWKAFTQCTYWKGPRAHTSCFRPALPFGALITEGSRIVCNTYFPPRVDSTAGDTSRLTTLLSRLLPNPEDREILTSYMAACVQYAGTKFSWCPILQGMEGNGKTLLGEIIAYACGHEYSFVLDPDKLKGGGGSQFNAWIDRRVFICIEEVYVGGSRGMVEKLKPIITNKRISVEDKNVKMAMGQNVANFLMLTNYVDAMPLTDTSRRYAPLLTAQQQAGDLERDGLTSAFFVDFFNWLDHGGGWAACAYYLRNYPIAERYNPAGICRTAPLTQGRATMIAATRDELEEQILEAVNSGVAGFASGWVSVTMLERLLKNSRLVVSSAKRAATLKKLGYIPHPNLPNGRAPKAVSPDGVRPTLYVMKDTPAAQLPVAAVCAAYEKAQTLATTAGAGFGQSDAL